MENLEDKIKGCRKAIKEKDADFDFTSFDELIDKYSSIISKWCQECLFDAVRYVAENDVGKLDCVVGLFNNCSLSGDTIHLNLFSVVRYVAENYVSKLDVVVSLFDKYNLSIEYIQRRLFDVVFCVAENYVSKLDVVVSLFDKYNLSSEWVQKSLVNAVESVALNDVSKLDDVIDLFDKYSSSSDGFQECLFDAISSVAENDVSKLDVVVGLFETYNSSSEDVQKRLFGAIKYVAKNNVSNLGIVVSDFSNIVNCDDYYVNNLSSFYKDHYINLDTDCKNDLSLNNKLEIAKTFSIFNIAYKNASDEDKYFAKDAIYKAINENYSESKNKGVKDVCESIQDVFRDGFEGKNNYLKKVS